MESQLIASYNTKLMVIVNEENHYCTRCQTFQVVQWYQAFCIDDGQTTCIPNETICSQSFMVYSINFTGHISKVKSIFQSTSLD